MDYYIYIEINDISSLTLGLTVEKDAENNTIDNHQQVLVHTVVCFQHINWKDKFYSQKKVFNMKWNMHKSAKSIPSHSCKETE